MMPKDLFGNEIQPGDIVVSATTRWEKGELRLGIVEDIRMRKKNNYTNHESETIVVKRITTVSPYDLEKGKYQVRRYYNTSFYDLIVIPPSFIPPDGDFIKALEEIKKGIMKDSVV